MKNSRHFQKSWNQLSLKRLSYQYGSFGYQYDFLNKCYLFDFLVLIWPLFVVALYLWNMWLSNKKQSHAALGPGAAGKPVPFSSVHKKQ